MAQVVEGNHENDSKRRVARILCLSSLAKFDCNLHFYFYERKQNKCVHVLYCDIITIKIDCWLNFLKLSLIFSCIQSINHQPLAAKK